METKCVCSTRTPLAERKRYIHVPTYNVQGMLAQDVRQLRFYAAHVLVH